MVQVDRRTAWDKDGFMCMRTLHSNVNIVVSPLMFGNFLLYHRACLSYCQVVMWTWV